MTIIIAEYLFYLEICNIKLFNYDNTESKKDPCTL